MTFISKSSVTIGDGPNLDAFSRLRVSQPEAVFDAQLTYDLQPTIFEQVTAGSGATIAHDTTNRCALLTFAASPVSSNAYMQTFEHFRYQPIKSQLIAVTFNFIEGIAGAVKFAGYSDRVNGIEFQNNETVNQFVLYSDTSVGDRTVTQPNWTLDKLDGTGKSGITLDITKTQIFIIDFQALYVGRVRVGFDIDGIIVYAHEFLNANNLSDSYIQTANLPIVCGMTSTATVSTSMKYICSAVASEGGQQISTSFNFSQSGDVVASNGTNTHLMSFRPKPLFKTFTNRVKFGFIEVEFLVTGSNPVEWQLLLGQALTGAAYTDVNATYSAAEYDVTGTLDGAPAIIINSGYVSASNQVKGVTNVSIASRFPITLDAAGAVRALGTLTLVVKGIGGTSQTYAAIKWLEIR